MRPGEPWWLEALCGESGTFLGPSTEILGECRANAYDERRGVAKRAQVNGSHMTCIHSGVQDSTHGPRF